jgi:hypothetical protein
MNYSIDKDNINKEEEENRDEMINEKKNKQRIFLSSSH